MKLLATKFLFAFLLLNSCLQAQPSFKKIGNASFYADKFEGRNTASGDKFHHANFTCAHRTLPFGTMLRVTNPSNQKSVVVRVNDRGPYAAGRIIDLTKAAAKQLEMIKAGEARVEIEIVSSEENKDSVFFLSDSVRPVFKIQLADSLRKGYTVKIAGYISLEKTLEVVRDLNLKTSAEIFIQTVPLKKQTLYRVFAGTISSKEEAVQLQSQLKETYPDCYVSELK